jgi:hypothetical protein
MADSTIDSELFVLFDFWPGVARRVHELPAAFTTAVETAVFGPGEKICIWNDGATAGVSGDATFVYLQVGTQNDATGYTIAAKMHCVPGSATTPFQVTNNPDANVIQKTGSPLLGMALGAMTDAYWGWFWCGGVCPEAHVSGLGGAYHTDNSVVIGPMSVTDCADDRMGFGVTGADTEAVIGMAYANDV